jgi:bifunctional DNA primase/polymerase-like protein
MSNSPFSRLAHRYAEHGFSPLPIRPGSKVPCFRSGHMKKWQQYCEKAADHRQIESWIRYEPESGLGLACGFNDLIGVDVDGVKAYPAIREVFAGTILQRRSGKKVRPRFFAPRAFLSLRRSSARSPSPIAKAN